MFGEKEQEKNTSPTVMPGVDRSCFKTVLKLAAQGASITLWACVEASGTGNILLVEGRMNSIKYPQILEANISPSVTKMTRGGLLQQDNVPNPQWTYSSDAS